MCRGSLTYRPATRRENAGDVAVELRRAGAALVSGAPPRPRDCDGCDPLPLNAWQSRPSVATRDLNGDGEPEALIDLYTGGANCCAYTVLYAFTPATSSYTARIQIWGGGYDLRRPARVRKPRSSLRRRLRLQRVLAAPGAGLVPSSRCSRRRDESLPSPDRRRCRRLWRAYLGYRRRGETDFVHGHLAAWLAEQHLLGRGRPGLSRVEAARHRGELGSRAAGRRYVRALRRFLARTGYTRR